MHGTSEYSRGLTALRPDDRAFASAENETVKRTQPVSTPPGLSVPTRVSPTLCSATKTVASLHLTGEGGLMPMHESQLEIDLPAVRRLVGQQLPQWAGLALRPLRSHGTVNLLFRLGEDLVLRFPLQGDDVETVRTDRDHEAAAARAYYRVTNPVMSQTAARTLAALLA